MLHACNASSKRDEEGRSSDPVQLKYVRYAACVHAAVATFDAPYRAGRLASLLAGLDPM